MYYSNLQGCHCQYAPAFIFNPIYFACCLFYFILFQLKIRHGLCKVSVCRKRGRFFKDLHKHLLRAHPNVTLTDHKRLPAVEPTEAKHMRYRRKEKCVLCGKTLLLLPHLKTAHKIRSIEEYFGKVRQQKGLPRDVTLSSQAQGQSTAIPSALPALKFPETETKRKSERKITAKRPGSRKAIHTPSFVPSVTACSEDELLRFFVHNCFPYQVQAACIAARSGQKDPINVLSVLSKGRLSREDCQSVVENGLLKKLYGFYRFCRLHTIPTLPCVCNCTDKSCSCDQPPESFYLFCRRPCMPRMQCKMCSSWGVGHHVCLDFFFCKFCEECASKRF